MKKDKKAIKRTTAFGFIVWASWYFLSPFYDYNKRRRINLRMIMRTTESDRNDFVKNSSSRPIICLWTKCFQVAQAKAGGFTRNSRLGPLVLLSSTQTSGAERGDQ